MTLVVERGFELTTIAAVIERARVPAALFEREFTDLADCCLQIYLANVAEFDRHVFASADGPAPWRDRLRATAYAAARYVRDRPLETNFDMTQMVTAGELAYAHRDRYVRRIVDLIDEGRTELDDPDALGRAAAEAAFGSVYGLLSKQLRDGGATKTAEEFVPELMYIAVLPYLGPEAAAEELHIPPPSQ
jgi:AcrR family transcriptional regulator